jgi:3',5'-cyclic-AMP phosphodiesterase
VRPVLIAQISDLHITPPGTFAYGCVDTAAALTRTIDTLNRLAPRPDLVVISGDIVHSALPEEYIRPMGRPRVHSIRCAASVSLIFC